MESSSASSSSSSVGGQALRSSDALYRRLGAGASIMMQNEEREKRPSRMDVEQWYEYIKDKTYATTFLPLSHEEAVVLHKACEDSRFLRKGLITASTLSGAQRDILSQLVARVAQAIASLHRTLPSGEGDSVGGVFVRLSKRSPKDSSLTHASLKERFLEELKKAEEEVDGTEEEEVAQVLALVRVTTSILAVRSGEEALHLLQNSERIFNDLTLGILEEGEDYKVNIILREFDPLLRPEMEFRAFINDRKMTALTQYNSMCYVPEIVRHKAQLEELVRHYFEAEVEPLLPFDSYVIDFTIRRDGQPFIIELNPFGRCTNAGLFGWERDKDVLYGSAPFECRVMEQPTNKLVLTELAAPLRQLLQEVRQEAEKKKQKKKRFLLF
ncbi:Insulin-degrading enzyme [Balamuthia mandrillaris]